MEHISPEDRRIVGHTAIEYCFKDSEYFDCADPLAVCEDVLLDTYTKRESFIKNALTGLTIRRSSGMPVKVSPLVAVSLIEHEARQTRNRNKRKYED
jgi:hypothetical protein